MAFELPAHLPRGTYTASGASFSSTSSHANPFLRLLSEATLSSLDASLASSWVHKVEESIAETKARIHKRVQDDLPSFDRQLHTSRNVKSRLESLTRNTQTLGETLNHEKSGLLPSLLETLSAHSKLAQEAQDSRTTFTAYSHLLKCQDELHTLSQLAGQGKLAQAVPQCEVVWSALNSAPEPLAKAQVVADINSALRVLTDNIREQLGDAYARSVSISIDETGTTQFVLNPSTQVPPSLNAISLSEILSSLPANVTGEKLSTLRKDVLSKLVDLILTTPSTSLSVSGPVLSITSHAGAPFALSSPLEKLTTLCQFLHTNLFPHLPHPQAAQWPALLYPPLMSSLLKHYLCPSMATSLSTLPAFLDIVSNVVAFERNIELLGVTAGREKTIRLWADDVGTHYEKRRREDLLESVRVLLLKKEDGPGAKVEKITVLGEDDMSESEDLVEPAPAQAGPDGTADLNPDAAWDFDADESQDTSTSNGTPLATAPTSPPSSSDAWSAEDDGDGWGFDDDEIAAEDVDVAEESKSKSGDSQASPSGDESPADSEMSEGDGWGWDESPVATKAPPLEDLAPASPQKSSLAAQPRPAARLEKFSAKAKNSTGTPSMSPERSQPLSSSAISSAFSKSARQGAPTPAYVPVMPPKQKRETIVETYVVSSRAQKVLRIAEDTLRESRELNVSGVFPTRTPPSGSLLQMNLSSTLDLFRALFPVTHAAELSISVGAAARFSNSCVFLADGAKDLAATLDDAQARERLEESSVRLRVLGESGLDDIVDQQCESVHTILGTAEGFVDTGVDERYAKCQSAMEQLFRHIMGVAQDLKETLTWSAYCKAVGNIVEEALGRVITDVLALPDITAVESHSLSHLCKILNPLESLFTPARATTTMVFAHVPSWLKYSYLQELLEATIADITYLFEEGDLIDFDVDELAKLLRALFSDTPLRAQTIAKIMAGHPSSNRV
ncbi:hypothetical protein BOTBODRAFT_126442 [Botryobasidium botryosum FD-172 SS1]|uniref:Retrograde transport protein Dsl1 C-terminal domain-containing protein n=1 Tax=Botryobasidium botryosum (strain FD-172 SS1) TaxID=930990 RepID=A0A067MXX7_BOTB1|nr:hypothetical protein BOTBODRAFT_126442 [Botryobasidium botryosum FD-172 SS1]